MEREAGSLEGQNLNALAERLAAESRAVVHIGIFDLNATLTCV